MILRPSGPSINNARIAPRFAYARPRCVRLARRQCGPLGHTQLRYQLPDPDAPVRPVLAPPRPAAFPWPTAYPPAPHEAPPTPANPDLAPVPATPPHTSAVVSGGGGGGGFAPAAHLEPALGEAAGGNTFWLIAAALVAKAVLF